MKKLKLSGRDMLELEACCRSCRCFELERKLETFRSDESGNYDNPEGYVLKEVKK